MLIVTLIDFGAEFWLTDYVRLLTLKLALVAGLVSLAIYNKFRLTPRLHVDGPARLRRAITAELVLIAGILGATAVLTSVLRT